MCFPHYELHRDDGHVGVFHGKEDMIKCKIPDELVPDCACLLAGKQYVLLGGEDAKVQCIPLNDGALNVEASAGLVLGMDDVSCMSSIPHSSPPSAVVGDDSGDLFLVTVTPAAGDAFSVESLSSSELPLPHTSGLASLVVMSCEPGEAPMLVSASYDCAIQAQVLPGGDAAATSDSPAEAAWTAKVEALPPLDITDAAGRPLQSAGGVGSNPPFPHCAVELPGRRVALGCGDGTVRILSAHDGRTLSICVGVHTAGVACMDTVAHAEGGFLLFTGGLDGRMAAWRIEDDLQEARVQEGQEDGAVDVLTSKDVAWVTRLPTDSTTERRWNANAVCARCIPPQADSHKLQVSVAVAREAPECAGHIVVYTLSVYNA